jgi:hypothetical protein
MLTNLKRTLLGRGAVALLLCIGILTAGHANADQELVELTVNGEVFKKVIVTSKSATDVFLSHSRGMTTLKVADLDPEARAVLGYEPLKPRGVKAAGIEALNLSKLSDGHAEQNVEEMKAQLIEQWNATFGHLDLNPRYIALGFLGVFAVMYLFTCYCFHSICKKTGHNPGIVVWLPVLQIFPILKAAGMGSWWFFSILLSCLAPVGVVPMLRSFGPSPMLLLLLLPHAVALVGMILWCFKICQARGIGAWVGVLLLLPVVSFFAFLYLAFANPTPNISARNRDHKTAKWGKSLAQDTSFFAQT